MREQIAGALHAEIAPWDACTSESCKQLYLARADAVIEALNLEPVKTWYRALTSDGKLWIESSSPYEVREQGLRHPTLRFEKCETYKIQGDWEEWDRE